MDLNFFQRNLKGWFIDPLYNSMETDSNCDRFISRRKKFLITIYCDGASKGNPGPSSIGIVAYIHEKEEFRISERIGETTNNVAEWSALKKGIEECISRKFDSIHAYMDSELVVKQVNGKYKVKHPNLLEYKKEVDKLISSLHSFQITHVPREKNSVADKLANEAFRK